jgi:hypothetical protein
MLLHKCDRSGISIRFEGELGLRLGLRVRVRLRVRLRFHPEKLIIVIVVGST